MRLPESLVVLLAFAFGLAIDLSRRTRFLVAAFCLLAALLTLILHLSRAAETARPADDLTDAGGPEEVHALIVGESFDRLAPAEGAALAGVLHENRLIVRSRPEPLVVDALELHEALRLASEHASAPVDRLHRLYRLHWIELRRTVAPALVATLESHPRVVRLVPYPDSSAGKSWS